MHQRIDNLEEKNRKLENAVLQMMTCKEKTDKDISECQDNQNELFYKQNEMKIIINSIISEVNDVITNLNNKL